MWQYADLYTQGHGIKSCSSHFFASFSCRIVVLYYIKYYCTKAVYFLKVYCHISTYDSICKRSNVDLTLHGHSRNHRTVGWSLVLTCNENTRSAGMGMIAAAKKVHMLLSEVSRMLRPVLLSTTPVCSCLHQSIQKMNTCNTIGIWMIRLIHTYLNVMFSLTYGNCILILNLKQ